MSKTNTLPKTAKPDRGSAKRKREATAVDGGMDWAAFHALTDEQVVAAALTDPDNLPLNEADFKRMKRRPRVFVIRRALRLSQEAFATRFRIPVGTLRDWEQGRTEPDEAAKAYLKVIAFDPEFVARALAHRPDGG
jgi:putative transcriptional regulator